MLKVFVLLLRLVERKGRFTITYRPQFVSVLHEVMVHSTLLPKVMSDDVTMMTTWWNTSRCLFCVTWESF